MASRLWLDDRRQPPWGYDLWAKTADQAIAMLEDHEVEHASLDHDLDEAHYEGAGDTSGAIDRSTYANKTGYAVIEWMHARGHWVADITVHTLNGRAADEMMMKLREWAPSWVCCRRVAFRRP